MNAPDRILPDRILPGSIAWFARHEWRLAWRDWRVLMVSQGKTRTLGLIIGIVLLTMLLHVIAGVVLHPDPDLATAPSTRALVMITAVLVMVWTLMLSQAMEEVTRAFYARADLELILSSPTAAWRLFAVRIVAMAMVVMSMSLVLATPFINVLAWRGGARWLAAYPATMGLALLAVAVAVVLMVVMFQLVGPKRTRLIAQIVAAVIGAVFVIGLQFSAILSSGTLNRLAFLESDQVTANAPGPDSVVWVVTYAVMGHPLPLAGLLVVSVLVLAIVIVLFAPRFGGFAVATAGVAQHDAARARVHGQPNGQWGWFSGFRNRSPAHALRRKEWALLRRDPWLVSQTLVQILYLLPAAYLLWSRYDGGIAPATLLVPVLITASGQFSGGLAWLAISGEDAPELIQTAPISPRGILRAKTQAVMASTLAVFAPFLLALAALSIRAASIALVGIIVAGAAATAIQFWYRLQAHRGRIRRRQTASRLTTFAEAIASISLAATGAMVAAGMYLSIVPGVVSACAIFGAWLLSPARATVRA